MNPSEKWLSFYYPDLEKIAKRKNKTVQEVVDQAINQYIHTEEQNHQKELLDRQFTHYLYVK